MGETELSRQAKALKQLTLINQNYTQHSLFRALCRLFDLKIVLSEILSIIEDRADKQEALSLPLAQAFRQLHSDLKSAFDRFSEGVKPKVNDQKEE